MTGQLNPRRCVLCHKHGWEDVRRGVTNLGLFGSHVVPDSMTLHTVFNMLIKAHQQRHPSLWFPIRCRHDLTHCICAPGLQGFAVRAVWQTQIIEYLRMHILPIACPSEPASPDAFVSDASKLTNMTVLLGLLSLPAVRHYRQNALPL